MRTRYFGLLMKDILYAFRNYCFHIVIVLSLVFVVLINFVIAEDLTIKPPVYYYISYTGAYESALNTTLETMKKDHNNVLQMSSVKEIETNMNKEINCIGLVITGVEDEVDIEFLLHGYENEQVQSTLILAMKDEISHSIKGEINVKTEIINSAADQKEIPANKNILPLFLVMESTMLGFILIAALIFIEKDEGTIKSFAVTPGRLSEYLISKITVMAILGIMGSFLTAGLVMGLNMNYLWLGVLILLGSVFSATLGLIMASFFKTISESMIWILIVNLLLGLPLTSYLLPSYAPLYIKLLPTYYLLFSVKEAVFPTGNDTIIIKTVVMFILILIVLYFLSILAFKRNLERS
ncbi:ABC transporter permease [Fusibacter sp. 3D3]|uniref:ABC transporter permease n=1 Tax=Fusibacter sp. 3D3 TaxID=1048380 RepID=UPI000852BCAA|nr:ABC transporter permease [Fusibacter sp. 3D3]GAU79296.1 probable antibiotic-transport integral membranh Leu and Val rich protein ABC transporter [Fusibacter sp. 3D3]